MAALDSCPGLVEWAGWEDWTASHFSVSHQTELKTEEFSSSLDVIVKGTRDPAFEPRCGTCSGVAWKTDKHG